MIVTNWEIANLVLKRLRSCSTVAYDVETSGLDWKHAHPVGHVLTFGPDPSQDSFYIPVRHAGGGNLPAEIHIPHRDNTWHGDLHPFEKQMVETLLRKTIIGHNISFDMRFLHRLGWVPTGPVHDTMIMAYIVNELRPSFSLDSCCRDEKVIAKKGDDLYKHIGTEFGIAADRNSMAHFWRTDASNPLVWEYASGDGTSTWQLHEALTKQMAIPYYKASNRDYTLEQVCKIEMDLISVLHNISMRGMRVDEAKLDELIVTTKHKLAVAAMEIGDMNVKSPIEVEKYLRSHGITEFGTTESGKPSFNEKFLLTNEPGKRLVAIRKSRTLLNSFLEPMQTKHVWNGRVYPEIHQTRDEQFGTKTGRLSMSAPNLGAMPGKRQGDYGRTFRTIFIPDDGMEFVEADYSNQEIRICAHYCGAAAWMNGFNTGQDPHSSVAETLGIKRQHAKTINLAIMTGAGKAKIAAELGLSKEEGEAVVNQYFEGLPELKKFQRHATNAFLTRGFVSTLMGRRLQLERPDKAFTAVNRLTQGGGADMMKERMVAMDKLPNIRLSLSIYDSILFQTAKGDKKAQTEAVKVMADMSNLQFGVPMKVEYGSGGDWGAATFNTEGEHTWWPAKE